MASRTIPEWKKELEWAESTGNAEYAAQVRDLLTNAGEMMEGPAQPESPPEPTFLQTWGRPIAEAGGSLLGGAAGIPAGLPGIMAGAGLGGHAAAMGWDYLTDSPAPSPQQQVLSAGFNMMGGPVPAPNVGSVAGEASDALLARAARDAKLPPLTSGQRGNTLGQTFEGWLESSPTGAGNIYRQRQGLEGGMRSYVDETFPTELSRFDAGNLIREGVEKVAGVKSAATGRFPENTLKGRASELYDKLYSMIDPSGRINLNQSKELLAEHTARMASDPEYARLINTDPDMSRYLSTLEKSLREQAPQVIEEAGGVIVDQSGRVIADPVLREVGGKEASLPLYDTIKQFRTNVGEKLDDPFVTATGGIQGEKRRLYGVLSDDLAQGAEDIGGIEARQARSRADWFNRGLMKRLEQIDPVFAKTKSPEQVYDNLSRMVMRNVDGLAAAKKTLPADVWDEFSSTYLRRLINARPGAQNELGDAISYRTMATNLNKLKSESPEAWNLLAGESADALDNLQILANRFKDSEKFFNSSRTGTARALSDMGRLAGDVAIGSGAGILASGGPNVMPAVAGATSLLVGHMAIPWLASKVITSPSIRRAVEKLPTNLLAGVTTPSGIARALIAAGADEAEVSELFGMEQQ